MRRLLDCVILTILTGMVINACSVTKTGKAEESPLNSSFDDGIVATDAIGRALPTWEEAGDIKPGSYVGLFYWLWHSKLRNNCAEEWDWNVTLSNERQPQRYDWQFAEYYWAKPELGYYHSTDKFVMHKHMNLFCLMGIDFLFLDFTNDFGNFDAEALRTLIEVVREVKDSGANPPKLVPFFNAGHDGPKHNMPYSFYEKYYNEFVKDGKNDDLWFYYEGKPLMLAPDKHPTDSVLNDTFTWRSMWSAFDPKIRDKWRYFDNWSDKPSGPHPALRDGKVEQMVVSKSLGGPIWEFMTYGGASSTLDHAPEYDQYYIDPENKLKGRFFEEQSNKALEVRPPVLCITGWNEWKAGAWPAGQDLVDIKLKFRGEYVPLGGYYFVDEWNQEFNRDFEPQADSEYSDTYYYQLASFVRRYKGMAQPQKASRPRTIKVSGDFSQWDKVSPVFKDFKGDTQIRNHEGTPKGVEYVDSTARADIVESRVSWDKDNVYFYVRTAEELPSFTEGNWMYLFIDADKEKATGWEGYDFAVNLDVISDSKTTLKKRAGDGWETVAECDYRCDGDRMQIAVPKAALGIEGKPSFYFHWMDNMQRLDEISEFFLHGDSAPERRYNYFYNAI